jgi:hypothetical protein
MYPYPGRTREMLTQLDPYPRVRAGYAVIPAHLYCSRLLMEDWHCAVNAPVAVAARKYVMNPSAVIRLNLEHKKRRNCEGVSLARYVAIV